jgi:hypothetical protein
MGTGMDVCVWVLDARGASFLFCLCPRAAAAALSSRARRSGPHNRSCSSSSSRLSSPAAPVSHHRLRILGAPR